MAVGHETRHDHCEFTPVAVAVGRTGLGTAPGSFTGACPSRRLNKEICDVVVPVAGVDLQAANSVSMTRPTTIEELHQYCAALEQQVTELQGQLRWFQEQARLAQKQRSGRSSERTVAGQLQFVFNEIEAEAKPEEKEPELETSGTYKRKKRRSRSSVLEGIPDEQTHCILPEDEQVCPQCAGRLHEMSTSIRREIRVIPAQVKVIEHVQHVYACRACERTGIRTPVVTAPMPKPPIPGSYASPSAIASVIHNKYVQGIPLYRQEQEFSRLGVGLSRQTLANQTLEATERHPVPIYERLHTELLKGDIIQADETTVQVLRELGRAAETHSYMWLYRSGRDGPPIVLFDYRQTRSGPLPQTSGGNPSRILRLSES